MRYVMALVVALVLALPTAAGAQASRGGEHDDLAFPLVPRVNTLDWSLRTSLLNRTAPSLSFNVQ